MLHGDARRRARRGLLAAARRRAPPGFVPELLRSAASSPTAPSIRRRCSRPRRGARSRSSPPRRRRASARSGRAVGRHTPVRDPAAAPRPARPTSASRNATYGTVGNGAWIPRALTIDEHFWRVVGLYLARAASRDGHEGRDPVVASTRSTRSISSTRSSRTGSPRHQGPDPATPTARVVVSRRASWRLVDAHAGPLPHSLHPAAPRPDLGAVRSSASVRCSLASSRATAHGRSSTAARASIIEWGTVSDELADGIASPARMSGSLPVAARHDGEEHQGDALASHFAVPSRSSARSLPRSRARPRRRPDRHARQQKRIKPTGYRRFDDEGPAWVRVVGTERSHHRGPVYSLDVPAVTPSVNQVLVPCFPKDVTALKQLAGNSGYHFQLLNSVIEVNELQKRRVMQKLQKHLGPLVGQEDRAARAGLQAEHRRHARGVLARAVGPAAGRRRRRRAYDPVAEEEARKLIHGVEFADSALRPSRAPTPSCS